MSNPARTARSARLNTHNRCRRPPSYGTSPRRTSRASSLTSSRTSRICKSLEEWNTDGSKGVDHAQDCQGHRRLQHQAHPHSRRSQGYRQGPHRHQRQPACPAQVVLQGQEVRSSRISQVGSHFSNRLQIHSPRPPIQADPRHPPKTHQARVFARHREAEEEEHTLPSAKVRRQGIGVL
jgi:hypothetical protein